MKPRSKSFRQPLIKGREEEEKKPQAKTKISLPTLFLRLYGVATAMNVGERERLGQGATTTALQKGTLLHLS